MMKNEIKVPLHRAVDAEDIKTRIMHTSVKGFCPEKAEEFGLFMRISNLICAMHSLVTVGHYLFGEVDNLFELCNAKRHEIKKACTDFESAYSRWFKFWRDYQTVDGVLQMNEEAEILLEQFMRWCDLPVRWELGQKQNRDFETEPMIEIDREDRIWRIWRDVAECHRIDDGETADEYGVFKSRPDDGSNNMICVERGIDKADVKIVASRMSADDPEHVYVACRMETVAEKRLEVVPLKAFLDGKKIGEAKEVIVNEE